MNILRSDIPVGLCSDHAGFHMKQHIIEYLQNCGITVVDFGTHSEESCDYPDFAHPCAIAVEKGEVYPAIAICGTGNGIAITLNKHQEVRAAICWQPELAGLARRHNDANILVLPGRFIDFDLANSIVDTFLSTSFEGGRHLRRINKISTI